MEQKIQPTHRRFLSSRSLPRQSGQIWILSSFGPCHRQMPQRILKHYHSARSLKKSVGVVIRLVDPWLASEGHCKNSKSTQAFKASRGLINSPLLAESIVKVSPILPNQGLT